MRGGSHAEVAERTPQIAIGISENELTVAGLGRSFHLPAAAALGVCDVVTLPVAIAIFAGSIRWARRHGRLSRG